MGRYQSKGIIIRDLPELTLVFYDKSTIYMYPKKYRIGSIFHRWYAQRGSGRDWQCFRWDLMRLKRLTVLKCFEIAASYDISVVSTTRQLDLTGRKVIYKK